MYLIDVLLLKMTLIPVNILSVANGDVGGFLEDFAGTKERAGVQTIGVWFLGKPKLFLVTTHFTEYDGRRDLRMG
jgi:hypothetical protein